MELLLKVTQTGSEPLNAAWNEKHVKAKHNKGQEEINFDNCSWNIKYDWEQTSGIKYAGKCEFTYTGTENFYGKVILGVAINNWKLTGYMLAPAAAYNGNRFNVMKKKYPPMFSHEEMPGTKEGVFITNVPHLKLDGNDSYIHLLSGDMATPCMGVFQWEQRTGLLFYGPHITGKGYTGFCFKEDAGTATIELEAPGIRKHEYRNVNWDAPSTDKAGCFENGDSVVLETVIYEFPCENIHDFYEKFWETRHSVEKPGEFVHKLPFSAAFEIIEEKYHREQWNDEFGYWRVGSQDFVGGDWQAGWVGGGMNTHALILDGNTDSAERSETTLNTIFTTLQYENGYICPMMYKGEMMGDDFNDNKNKHFLLLRKNADLLFFAARTVLHYQSINKAVPESWMKGLKKLADVFVRLHRKYGQLGQFIDTATDTILAGGTASAAAAAGGLVLAGKALNCREYIDTALEVANWYIVNSLDIGLLNGGPGEILQNSDSESAFGLLESFIILYEETGDKKWLEAAKRCGWQCASWTMNYDFVFPPGSEFHRHDMKTTGSVFANTQNKHSAPGICTFSPLAVFKLYIYTGDRTWLEFAREIAHNITQYLSTEENPVHSWDADPLPMPPGWMCERVNTSDWEGKENVGELFYGSCWCEVSCLLTYAEMPGIMFDKNTGEAVVFDHVKAKKINETPEKWQYEITNPTKYSAKLKILVRDDNDLSNWDSVSLPAGETQSFTVLR